ncbi:Uu.00g070210.m01.CDS01 [Anthostomella pinea]|uniref:Uu.00g070210.m01.CDS01 n=1 Tax=Anthostomella pinea TaxID=933095 RepID=A0AAI8VP19_9PEZI|nr:Uu.00g070210.m01.CDS01 [Anthostomella pinea]
MNSRSTKQSTLIPDDLAKYGWVDADFSSKEQQERRKHIDPVYKKLGIKEADEVPVGYLHQATKGSFESLFDKDHIVACHSESAATMTGPGGKKIKTPALNKWSDLTALVWQKKYGHGSGEKLKYIARSLVWNLNTCAMVAKAMKAAGKKELPIWPGVDFEYSTGGSDDLLAPFWGLLGTYHAAGPAYMLAQNRKVFGHKVIPKIKVWNEAKKGWPVSEESEDLYAMSMSMLIYVEDA